VPAIPLPQFPPDFRPRCHKCSSTNLNFVFTRHLWIWNQSEVKYNCCMCGIVGYGDSVVIARFTDQLVAWQKEKLAKEEARVLEEASLKAQAEMQRLAAEQALLKAKEDAMKLMTKLERRRAIDNAYRVKRREAAKLAAASGIDILTPEQKAVIEEKRAAMRERKRADDRAYKARIRAAEKARAAEKERKEAEVAASTAQAAAEAKLKMKCAWKNCDNPHTETSKYCSRTCSNRSAYLSARQRKAAQSAV